MNTLQDAPVNNQNIIEDARPTMGANNVYSRYDLGTRVVVAEIEYGGTLSIQSLKGRCPLLTYITNIRFLGYLITSSRDAVRRSF